MKRNTILAVVAGIMLAIDFGPYLLLLLVIAPFAYFIIKRKERTAVPRVTYATVEEAKQRYGEPDGVVVLDASRANELPALILFYPNHDIAIIAGEELKLSSLECVNITALPDFFQNVRMSHNVRRSSFWQLAKNIKSLSCFISLTSYFKFLVQR